jgi:hypothetical protein
MSGVANWITAIPIKNKINKVRGKKLVRERCFCIGVSVSQIFSASGKDGLVWKLLEFQTSLIYLILCEFDN